MYRFLWDAVISFVMAENLLKYDQSLSIPSPSDKPSPSHLLGPKFTFEHILVIHTVYISENACIQLYTTSTFTASLSGARNVNKHK